MPQPWSALFQINQNPLMTLNLEGVTQAMADRAPADGVNSITWLLRHILAYRLETLAALDAPSTPPLPEPRTLVDLAAAIGGTQPALARAFDAVADWTVVKRHPALPSPMPLDQIVGTFLVHDAYHAGQLGMARRLLGLPGAIKGPAERVHA
ncbi:MAG TPA: DinB family protein [Holophagaceae bacterium]|nr:DinB family protein [Holophagaceae bacterium]